MIVITNLCKYNAMTITVFIPIISKTGAVLIKTASYLFFTICLFGSYFILLESASACLVFKCIVFIINLFINGRQYIFDFLFGILLNFLFF